MCVNDLLSKTDRLGIQLRVHGQRLWASPRNRLTSDLLAELKQNKEELISCLASEGDRSGHGLCHLVGHEVCCPLGCGLLVSACRDWAVVMLAEQPIKVATVLPQEITNVDGSQGTSTLARVH